MAGDQEVQLCNGGTCEQFRTNVATRPVRQLQREPRQSAQPLSSRLQSAQLQAAQLQSAQLQASQVPPQRLPMQPKRSQWLQPFPLVLTGILFLLYLFVNPLILLMLPQSTSLATAADNESNFPITELSIEVPMLTVDSTEDIKAMGYPDGRKVARDSLGQLYVAYRKKYKLHYTTAYHIFVAKSQDNGRTWLVTNQGRPIETTGDTNQRVPAIAIDRDDVIHVVWYGLDDPDFSKAAHAQSAKERPKDGPKDGGNQIKYVRSEDGGATWSPWQNIGYVPHYQGEPLWQEHPAIYIDAIAPDAPAHEPAPIYLVWEGQDADQRGVGQIKFVKSLDGGHHWTPWQNVAPRTRNLSRPTIVRTVNGALHILAYGYVGKQPQILHTSSIDDGQTWQEWRTVAPAAVDQRHVSVAADATGRLHIVWRQPVSSLWQQSLWTHGPDEPTKTQIFYATYDGARWSQPHQVHADPTVAQTFPSVSISRAGTVWLAWSQTGQDCSYPNDALQAGAIYYMTKDDAGWHTARRLVTSYNEPATTSQHMYISLARPTVWPQDAGADTMDVVWLERDQAQHRVRFMQLTSAPNTASQSARVKHKNSTVPFTPSVTPNHNKLDPHQPNVVRMDMQVREFPMMASVALPFSQIDRLFLNDLSLPDRFLSSSPAEALIMYSADLVAFAQTLWGSSLARELIVLVALFLIITLYVLLKFIVTRWQLLDHR